MLKVPYGQDPYSVIGKYIRDHITAIEDIIAVIKIGDITTNQLFMADMNEENYFIWDNDWYEGEKDVALIDFFPVSEAINPSAQPVAKDINVPINDCISRQAAIAEIARWIGYLDDDMIGRIQLGLKRLPSAQPEIVLCKDCIFHGLCRTSPKWAVAPKDDWFCADAERRTDEA